MELELEIVGDVGVAPLLLGQGDGQADVEALGLGGAAVGGLHDPRPAAGADDEPPALLLQALRPSGQPAGELAALLVVPGHPEVAFGGLGVAAFGPRRLQPGLGVVVGDQPGRAEEHDGVADLERVEAGFGMEVLGKDAERPGVAAADEPLVGIGLFNRGEVAGHGRC